MTTRQSERRRQWIVNPAVQSSIIVNISWPPAVALAVAALLLGWFSMRLLDEALVARVELPSLVPMLVTVIGFLVVGLAFLVFHALKLSHRVAGPMYRLQKTIEAAQAGDYTARAILRQNDYLAEVADSLNSFLEVLDREQVDGPGAGGAAGVGRRWEATQLDAAEPAAIPELTTSLEDVPGPQGLGEPRHRDAAASIPGEPETGERAAERGSPAGSPGQPAS